MPGRPSVWIHELSWDEIDAQLEKDDVALVPIGATEQHGVHAPLLLDTGWAITVSEAAAKAADCLVAPPMHYGWSHGHMAYPGTIGLRAETLTAVALDIGECLLRHGFRRIVYVNGNRGANLAPMEIAAAKLRMATGALTAVADCGLLARTAVAGMVEAGPGTIGHAGETETSMVLAYYPHLVDMTRATGRFEPVATPAETGKLRPGHTASDPRLDGDSVYLPHLPEDFHTNTEARGGTVGDETLATAEKGKAMVAAIAGRLAEIVTDLRTKPVEVRVPGIVA
jgi:creatinine amidohydrolase